MREWIKDADKCIVSKKILLGEAKLLWAWREDASLADDSGWRFLSDADTEESLQLPGATQLVSFNEIATIEPSVVGIYYYPLSADFQFANQDGVKHFVYNDDFSPVALVDAPQRLPLDQDSFKRHFPEYVALASQQNIARPNLDFQLEAEGHDLIDVLLADRQGHLANFESYLLIGLLAGYYRARYQSIPLSHQDSQQVILHIMCSRFNIQTDQVLTYLDYFVDQLANPLSQAEAQLLVYGQAMFNWYRQEDDQSINQAYSGLLNHHRKAQVR
ncbi:hypothetical protein AWM75_04540 [Aerococcus urinaehominis]|uniref:Immunity protein Imm33 domain-containing protein n=1 Tax=Aerococcus urinaehominis TaxID=128944 RepID=A0A0X8FL53_9LACT|nr:DUF2185 domain-containing protein [Aerococcus urinaehominis]AMB99315.1 hypothetical protein AWM75_04540 [Aerococcus urinaehominis]SDM19981.1 hypothetical protein SAMN04487985_10836 [Aerococcus urinaehominis]